MANRAPRQDAAPEPSTPRVVYLAEWVAARREGRAYETPSVWLTFELTDGVRETGPDDTVAAENTPKEVFGNERR